MIKNHKETAKHYEKMLQNAEKVGQSDWDIEQIKKMVAFHKTMANEYKSDKMGKGGLTKNETLKVAEKFAKALSKTENKKVTVNMRTLEEDSFDLDMDGIEYDGGSYNIYDNGDVKNMALRESPVYGKTTSTQSEIENNLSKMGKGGSISKKYTVNVYYGGEMEDEEFYTDSLEEAKKISQQGEHSEIYDNIKKEFVEIEYAKGGETKSYEVELSAESNPDYDKSSHEGSVNIKSYKVKAKSIENARDIVVAFIMENDLGSGNWSGGNVYKNGKKVGHISYNGRYWDDTKKPPKDTQRWIDAIENGCNTKRELIEKVYGGSRSTGSQHYIRRHLLNNGYRDNIKNSMTEYYREGKESMIKRDLFNQL